MRLFKFSFVQHLSSNSKRDNSAAVGAPMAETNQKVMLTNIN